MPSALSTSRHLATTSGISSSSSIRAAKAHPSSYSSANRLAAAEPSAPSASRGEFSPPISGRSLAVRSSKAFFCRAVAVQILRSVADHKRTTGGAAAANVKRGKLPCSLDLVVPGGLRDLTERIQELTDAGCAHRMARANQAAAGIDRQLPTQLDYPFFHRFP